MTLAEMLITPGVYAVTTRDVIDGGIGGPYVLIEVTNDGRAYQMTPSGRRDGPQLSRNGWRDDVAVLRRVPHPDYPDQPEAPKH